MIMAKATTLSIATLLLILIILPSSHVLARPHPAYHDVTPMDTHHQGNNEMQKGAIDRDSCVGLEEDECLMRNNLEAHLDYIYTQKKNKP
ncbi:hypothetical protein CASFOL_042443 [Castilleja foliolosa]|uniref:Phytosulfokine n=1 Tax=Castilleja foliolosa TaxID=1961234 RepID=A0ABD3BAT1_9LAMI